MPHPVADALICCCRMQFGSALCNSHGPHTSDATSRLCHYLPMVQEQIKLAVSTIFWSNACLAALTLAASCAGSWHMWELAYVEKKAAKHKRRRKHRKNAIPWDKIKVGRVDKRGGRGGGGKEKKMGRTCWCGAGHATNPCAAPTLTAHAWHSCVRDMPCAG